MAAFQQYGVTVAIPGDMDGDTVADMVISAPAPVEDWHANPAVGPRVEFFRGGVDGPDAEPDSTLIDECWHLTSAGDVDGAASLGLTAYADLAMERRPRGTDGRAIGREGLVVHGSSSLIGEITLVRDAVGGSEPIAGAGDVDSDGFDVVVVGDGWWFEPPSGETTGRAWLHHGQSSAFGLAPPEPPHCCAHPTDEELATLMVADVTFGGAGFVPIDRDTGERYPAVAQWLDGGCFPDFMPDGVDDIPGCDHRIPVAYVQGSSMQLAATFMFKAPLSIPDGCLEIWGLGPGGAVFTGSVAQGIDGNFHGTFTSSIPLADKIAFHDEYQVKWQASRDGLSWVNIGKARTRVYVLLAAPDPSLAKHYETVMDIACRSAGGQTTVAGMVAGVYSEFTSPMDGVARKPMDGYLLKDGTAMQYWADVGTDLARAVDDNATGPGDVTTLRGVLNPSPTPPVLEGIGTCGAWTELLMACLRVHGVPAAPYNPHPTGELQVLLLVPNYSATGMIVKDHAFGLPALADYCTRNWTFVGEALPLAFTHIDPKCADAEPPRGVSCDQPGIAGQNAGTAANPRSHFAEHALVTFAGRLYDPSYGLQDVALPNTAAAQRDLEHTRLAGYFTPGCLGPSPETHVAAEERDNHLETHYKVVAAP